MTKSRHILAPRIVWTDEQIAVLKARYPHEKTATVARDLGVAVDRVYSKIAALGLKKTDAYLASPDACRLRRGDNIGAANRFTKGHTTWNKGTHFTAGGRSAETRFKKGHKHNSEAPLGALRINADGYLERKTSMAVNPPARRWVAVHRLVWIETHGKVPKGHIVVFKQGMRSTNVDEITLDKVELISRAENMKRNTLHNYPKEIAQLIQLRGAVQRKINRRIKENERDHPQPAE